MTRAWLRLLSVLALLALWGCAAPPREGEGKERTTASDQTDGERRARVRLELASAYFDRGQTDTALDEVKLALQVFPDYAPAYNLRGLIYAQLGDDRLAEDSFRRALQISPRDGDTLNNFAWFQCQRQRYPESTALFRQALAVPQYVNAARTLAAWGVCQARAGQWSEAEASLQRSFELDPGNPVTAVNLAEVLLRRGELERARFYVRRVNQQNDLVSAQTLWLAARIEKRMNNQAGVFEFGDQLRKRFPQSPEAARYEGGRFDD